MDRWITSRLSIKKFDPEKFAAAMEEADEDQVEGWLRLFEEMREKGAAGVGVWVDVDDETTYAGSGS